MDRWNETRDIGSTSDTGNVEYFRALKRTSEVAAVRAPAQNSQGEKRRNPRHKCEGSAEFRSEGTTVRTWAMISDLSRSGCYVEMQATSPADTQVDMTIEVMGVRVNVKGVVRVSYPFLGMGIAFTEISPVDQARLEELLMRLASGVTTPMPPASAEVPGYGSSTVSKVGDPRAALSAVAAFFHEHNTLTREQFLELIAKHGAR